MTSQLMMASGQETELPPVEGCLRFTPKSGTVSISVANPSWDGTLEYSTNGTTWSTFTGEQITGDVLFLRGFGNTGISASNATSSQARWTISTSTGSTVACDGNIENLLDYPTVESLVHPSMRDGCFLGIFASTPLSRVPDLPSPTLSRGCYQYIFSQCTSLIKAPALPATTLAPSCYFGMFSSCTSLIKAPELPATSIGYTREHQSNDWGCYNTMFAYCTSLTTPPALHGLISSDCSGTHYRMFYGCSSLTSIPAFYIQPFQSAMVENGFGEMFRDCVSIKMSETQTEECPNEYRIHAGDISVWLNTHACEDMFTGTSGTYTGSPIGSTPIILYTNLPVIY